jgi:hypothetical protein
MLTIGSQKLHNTLGEKSPIFLTLWRIKMAKAPKKKMHEKKESKKHEMKEKKMEKKKGKDCY